MRVVGWVVLAVSLVVAAYCATFALVGALCAVALWFDPHDGVAILASGGLILAPLILRRSADQAAEAVYHLPAADPVVADAYRSAVRMSPKGRLTVRSCPGDRVVVLRGRRRTMVLAPVGLEPSEGARRAARDLDLGRGWVLPWVMRVVRLPGVNLAGFRQGLRKSRESLGQSDPTQGGRSGALFCVSFVSVPAAIAGWAGAQLAMLLVGPRLLAAYAALTGTPTENGRLGVRERLLLPITWYRRSQQIREPFEPAHARPAAPEPTDAPDTRAPSPQSGASTAEPYLVLVAGLLLFAALVLAVSGPANSIVWWDERSVTGTVSAVDTVPGDRPRISPGWHPDQKLTVALAQGQEAFVTSSASTYEVGDPIRLAGTGDLDGPFPAVHAVPSKSAYDRGVDLVFGFGWAAVCSFVITYQGSRAIRNRIWDGPAHVGDERSTRPRTR